MEEAYKGRWRYGGCACISLMVGLQLVSMRAHAQACDISRLALQYGGRVCLNRNCVEINQRWQILGTRILHSPDANKNDEGIVWELGRTVDMMSDPTNLRFEPTGIAGEREASTLTAERTGSDVVLTRHNRLTKSNGQILANKWQRIVVRLPSCERCELLTYDLSGDFNGYPSQTTFAGNWCRILN